MSSAAAAPAVLQNDFDPRLQARFAPRPYLEYKHLPYYGGRTDVQVSHMTLDDGRERTMDVDPVAEQIERNRRIVEQMSPVLKYKEMMRKCRSRAAPRRKFSIAQGYPRITRWKSSSSTQSRVGFGGAQICPNNVAPNW
ncbi:unnamed protein product [Heligmosomoides polygyrus]|uniref:SLBP_RNA_bind domain-containing protein n=1 Tax=Heligmosomoides polygyrus TaxID=6339 RepID=A0A183FRT1_HELPZ|nr:unnamed protein product [Heligmosomoides polygyrus]